MKILADVIVLPAGAGRWVLYNVFSRTSLGVETKVLDFLGNFGETETPAIVERHSGDSFAVFEIGYFSNYVGLMADPTRMIRDAADWPPALYLDPDTLVERLKKEFILCDDEEAYRARFTEKKTLVDFENFGNFHQQLGQYLMAVKREDPQTWWLKQKFEEDLGTIRNNLYRGVNEYFLRGYIARHFKPGDSVLDLGCGTGFFTNLIAATGATTVGVDPNPTHIGIAQQQPHAGARYVVGEVGTEEGFSDFVDTSFDYVFMSDALLFYFVEADPRHPTDLGVLLPNIRRVLKPDGRFISVEPHYLFWLAPWFGTVDRPFTVFTEYRNKSFGVTPTISTMVQALNQAGFALTWMEDAEPDPAFAGDLRGAKFAAEFPLWQLMEFAPI